jgi:general stress protein 26
MMTVVAVASCSAAPERDSSESLVGEAPREELRMASDEAAVREAARALMVADPVVALVTVDAAGQPRVRSVRALLEPETPGDPQSGFTVWVMTRLTTRKVDQIRAHPQVALYFSDDQQDSYASIMGTALVHTDAEHPEAKRRYQGEDTEAYWPDFPRDFVMLEIRPEWLEFIGPGVSNDERTWRPQAVVFK